MDPDAAGSIKFVTMGTGFHATNPQAAIYWNPSNTASGAYTLKGTFTLTKDDGATFSTVFTSGAGNVVGITGATGYRAIAYVSGAVVAGSVWTVN